MTRDRQIECYECGDRGEVLDIDDNGARWILCSCRFGKALAPPALSQIDPPEGEGRKEPLKFIPNEMAEKAQAAIGRSRMIVCEFCGNKRCPHASNKEFACTGSNEPGQVGVRSEDVIVSRVQASADKFFASPPPSSEPKERLGGEDAKRPWSSVPGPAIDNEPDVPIDECFTSQVLRKVARLLERGDWQPKAEMEQFPESSKAAWIAGLRKRADILDRRPSPKVAEQRVAELERERDEANENLTAAFRTIRLRNEQIQSLETQLRTIRQASGEQPQGDGK